MIARTYGRRTRSLGNDDGPPSRGDNNDCAAAAVEDLSFSQDSFNDPFAFSSQEQSLPYFSSQESFAFSTQNSHFSLDSFDDDLAIIPPPPMRADSVVGNGSKRAKKSGRGTGFTRSVSAAAAATLMEAEEFGEMMEHVDEVNFALDGLRRGQPVRIRRASLLSLLLVCASPSQRRLLRAQGMTKRILNAVVGLSFDDSPSIVAAATLFYVLTSDVQDAHLLDSPSCIQFLLDLLNPPTVYSVEDKVPTLGSELLGMQKPKLFGSLSKELDFSSKAIISKVHDILLNCKEIKLCKHTDIETERPELSSKWISLLTMEKACLSMVSLEDTSETVRSVKGHFKERLRYFGGLDAIFNVAAKCNSTFEVLSKQDLKVISKLRNGAVLRSAVHFSKCLKVMENATFLSKENQNHLLGMKAKLDTARSDLSFVAVIINGIKFLSDLSIIQNDERSNSLSQTYQQHNELSSSQSDTSVPNLATMEKKTHQLFSVPCNGTLPCQNGKGDIDSLGSNISVRGAKGWISIKINASRKDLGVLSKRPRTTEDVNANQMDDNYDPFTFDEQELKPSKWEVLASKKEEPQTQLRRASSKLADKCKTFAITKKCELTQSTNDGNYNVYKQEGIDPSVGSVVSSGEKEPTILEDCLLTAIKVLMNLTNDNPLGCQQIGACDGLNTMVSLIVKHFPSFQLTSMEHTESTKNGSVEAGCAKEDHLSDFKLDFLVAILGLLVNLVEKDNQNRSRLALAHVVVGHLGSSASTKMHKDVIQLLCSIFLANQGAGEATGEGKLLLCDDEDSLLEGQREAERMIVEAYAALLLAFLSTESRSVREAIASHLPNRNLRALVPVLERFVVFHLTLNMISPETHSAVSEVIEYCRQP